MMDFLFNIIIFSSFIAAVIFCFFIVLEIAFNVKCIIDDWKGRKK